MIDGGDDTMKKQLQRHDLRKLVQQAVSELDDPWRVGNDALYDLCRKYPW